MTNLEALKLEASKEMSSFMKDKKNSYDRHLQEDAYWTAYDCIALVKGATTREAVFRAKSIFDRYKWYL